MPLTHPPERPPPPRREAREGAGVPSGALSASGEGVIEPCRCYIAAMRWARRLASGVAGSGAGGGWMRLVERGSVQSHSSAPS